MYFVTPRRAQRTVPNPNIPLPGQISFNDLWLNMAELNTTPMEEQPTIIKEDTYTRTYTETKPHKYKTTPLELDLNDKLFEATTDRFIQNLNYENYYEHFLIPKSSGGFRQIDAPTGDLKLLQEDILHIFKKSPLLYHDACYAYTKQRSTKEAMERHQENHSRWFLKIDMKDFFPCHTPEYIIRQMNQIYPYNFWGTRTWDHITKIACYNGKLPQGSPLSPMLTNLCMIPFDYELTCTLHTLGNFVYTRYADDLTISSRYNFDHTKIIELVKALILRLNMPLKINDDKTRYGSANGSNWNLGLMLNKDNKITLGAEKKRRIKATIHNFLQDWTNGQIWSRIEVQALQGTITYFKKIEPEYFAFIVTHYNQKFHTDLSEAIRYCLNH